jgi:hypothetical protein
MEFVYVTARRGPTAALRSAPGGIPVNDPVVAHRPRVDLDGCFMGGNCLSPILQASSRTSADIGGPPIAGVRPRKWRAGRRGSGSKNRKRRRPLNPLLVDTVPGVIGWAKITSPGILLIQMPSTKGGSSVESDLVWRAPSYIAAAVLSRLSAGGEGNRRTLVFFSPTSHEYTSPQNGAGLQYRCVMTGKAKGLTQASPGQARSERRTGFRKKHRSAPKRA